LALAWVALFFCGVAWVGVGLVWIGVVWCWRILDGFGWFLLGCGLVLVVLGYVLVWGFFWGSWMGAWLLMNLRV
jgi:hypothetical protein